MRRHARRLHRDDLAVLVERYHRQYRAEKHRKGQEGLDDLRQPHPDITPHVRIAVAGNRQNLAAFAEQVERLEDQHQREEDREGADEEEAADIDRKSVVSGKSVSVRVDLGGRRIVKQQKKRGSTQNSSTK